MTNEQHFDAMKRFGGSRTLDTLCDMANALGFTVEWQGGMRVFTFTRPDGTQHVVEGQIESIAWLQTQA